MTSYIGKIKINTIWFLKKNTITLKAYVEGTGVESTLIH